MVKEELVEGIRLALSKGESLEKAMMTFFNAGYPREEIEEAAKYAQSQQLYSQFQLQLQAQSQTQTTQQKKSETQKDKKTEEQKQPINQLTTTNFMQSSQGTQQVIQRVSEYGTKKKSGKGLTIFLFSLLFLLIALLVFIILFREKVISFFGG
ncbi:MAG: hypothetical protein KatS3mg001_491 [Candidatus Pacearchaeota archaeon]|nr:MAG: hypothetical protein KatS3mg001_491 [Candidatus Pacearchaeota archaeon]